MKRHDAYPGSWLKSADLEGDFRVTIKSCNLESVGQGEDSETKPVMEFDETEKKLVLNQTNWDSIEALHGDDSDDWIGRKIVLYVDPKVRFGNKTVPAIRVRPLATRTVAAPPNGAGTLSYKQAVELCATAGLNEDDMKGWLKQNGLSAYNSVAATPLVRKLVAGLEPAAQPSDADEDLPF